MAHPRAIFQIFEMVELVLQGSTTRGFGEMMGLIDNDGVGTMLDQGFFHRFAHITHADS